MASNAPVLRDFYTDDMIKCDYREANADFVRKSLTEKARPLRTI